MRPIFHRVWLPGLAAAVGAALLGAAQTTNLQAGETVTFTGQIRARGELDGKAFDPEAGTRQYTDLRTRLAARATLHENTHAFIQLQDSRRLGGSGPTGSETSGTLTHDANVDVHQAYIEIDRIVHRLGLQVGRFEVNLGNERVFGAVGWHNVGRSWEGLRTVLHGDQVRLDGFWLKRLERDDPEENRDFDIVGIQAHLVKPAVDVFAFFENDAKLSHSGGPGSLERFDLGAYLSRRTGNVEVTSNLVYQAGNQEFGTVASGRASDDERTISALLATLEVGVFLGTTSRLAAGLDYASGDDDPLDDTLGAYDNLYYTGHKFRGAMDYFLGSRTEGLVDAMARGRTQLATGWTGSLDLHWFRSAVDYVDFEGNETSDIGVEIDAAAATTRVPGAKIDMGASAFFPSDSFAGRAGADPGLWVYTSVTCDF